MLAQHACPAPACPGPSQHWREKEQCGAGQPRQAARETDRQGQTRPRSRQATGWPWPRRRGGSPTPHKQHQNTSRDSGLPAKEGRPPAGDKPLRGKNTWTRHVVFGPSILLLFSGSLKLRRQPRQQARTAHPHPRYGTGGILGPAGGHVRPWGQRKRRALRGVDLPTP